MLLYSTAICSITWRRIASSTSVSLMTWVQHFILTTFANNSIIKGYFLKICNLRFTFLPPSIDWNSLLLNWHQCVCRIELSIVMWCSLYHQYLLAMCRSDLIRKLGCHIIHRFTKQKKNLVCPLTIFLLPGQFLKLYS